MTTIKVKNASKLKKTQFESLEELAEYIYDICLQEELPPLTESEIEGAKQAKAEWKKNPSSFIRVLGGNESIRQ